MAFDVDTTPATARDPDAINNRTGETPPDTLRPFHQDEVVELIVPARTEHLRLVRLAAAGVASTVGFGLDRLEELRIAVDELAAVAIDESDPSQRLSVHYAGARGTVTVTGRVATTATSPPELHRVAQTLLDLMADDYSLNVSDGHLEFHLVKHGTPDMNES